MKRTPEQMRNKLDESRQKTINRLKAIEQKINEIDNNQWLNTSQRQFVTYTAGRFFLELKKNKKLIDQFRNHLTGLNLAPDKLALFDSILKAPAADSEKKTRQANTANPAIPPLRGGIAGFAPILPPPKENRP